MLFPSLSKSISSPFFLSLSGEACGSLRQSYFRLADIPEDSLTDAVMTREGNYKVFDGRYMMVKDY